MGSEGARAERALHNDTAAGAHVEGRPWRPPSRRIGGRLPRRAGGGARDTQASRVRTVWSVRGPAPPGRCRCPRDPGYTRDRRRREAAGRSPPDAGDHLRVRRQRARRGDRLAPAGLLAPPPAGAVQLDHRLDGRAVDELVGDLGHRSRASRGDGPHPARSLPRIGRPPESRELRGPRNRLGGHGRPRSGGDDDCTFFAGRPRAAAPPKQVEGIQPDPVERRPNHLSGAGSRITRGARAPESLEWCGRPRPRSGEDDDRVGARAAERGRKGRPHPCTASGRRGGACPRPQ